MSDRQLSMVDFARSLARRGLREDALLILDLLPGEQTIETADLRARILTQLGRYAEAEDAWQQVLDECPDHQGATEGLTVAANLRKKPLARFRVACALRFRYVATVLLVLLLVAAALGSAALLWQRLHSLGKQQQTLLDAQTERNAEVDKKLAAVRQDAADLTNLQLNLRDSLVEVKGSVGKVQDQLGAEREANAAAKKEVLLRLSQAAAALKREIGQSDAATKKQLDIVKTIMGGSDRSFRTQISSLLQQQKSTAGSLAKLAELSGANDDTLGESLTALKKDLAAIKPSLTALAQAGSKQTSSLTETQNRLAAMDKRLDKLLAADPTKKLGELTEQYFQLRATLNTQKKQTEALVGQLKSLATKMDTINKAAATLTKQAPSPTSSAPAPANP